MATRLEIHTSSSPERWPTFIWFFYGSKASDILDRLDTSPNRQFSFDLTIHYKVLTGERKEPYRQYHLASDDFHVPQGTKFEEEKIVPHLD